MSKQLAISAALSVFATVAFVLFATPDHTTTGARTNAQAPAATSVIADLSD